MHNSISVPSTLAKFRENTQTDVRREEWAEPHRIFAATTRGLTSTTAAFVQLHYLYKYNCRLAFESQKQKVQCCSNKKLLHHSQHAKNQLNP